MCVYNFNRQENDLCCKVLEKSVFRSILLMRTAQPFLKPISMVFDYDFEDPVR